MGKVQAFEMLLYKLATEWRHFLISYCNKSMDRNLHFEVVGPKESIAASCGQFVSMQYSLENV